MKRLRTIYKMTRGDKRALKGHMGRMTLHLSAGDYYLSVRRYDSLHFTTHAYTPKKDGMVDPKGHTTVIYDVADADEQGSQGHGGLRECSGEWLAWEGHRPLGRIWESEPPVGRVASRIPARVDRLRALGNAVVPQQAYPLFKAIAEWEMKTQSEWRTV